MSNSTSTNSSPKKMIQSFIEGKVSIGQVIAKTGKSRATIYRYAKIISRGEEIIDRRKFGNNRKYGDKTPAAKKEA